MIRDTLPVKSFRSLPPGKFWLYPPLWPLAFSPQTEVPVPEGVKREQLKYLSLPSDLFFQIKIGDHCFWILDDTRNPTFSYKDRASELVVLKAIQRETREITVASTGNAGSSLAGICARLGLNANIWVPDSIPENKRLQIQAYGAHLHLVQGDYDMAFDVSLEVSGQKGWYNRNTAYNPLTIEGKKSGAYDMFIQFGREMPDYIFIPCGDGVILGGIYKGLREMLQLGWIEHYPQLVAVQAVGSDALVRYMDTHHFEYTRAQTMADSICAGAPRNLFMAAKALEETGGRAVVVSDMEILEAQKQIAQKTGILVEPAAAASLAGFYRFRESRILEKNAKVLLLFTGNGLKDMNAIESWINRPEAKSPEDWLRYYQ
ncbi:MAG: pyridoxal-phosphate dependent enzyme [Calditrichaeota bacterium]|nr:pyridoxal-phosphate dependent enzyme [Calditrichota bacterium]RQW00940.1 MAG: pyridoxal-phosphate dependent enzyme [Calditrichota bacterium]